MFDQFGNQYGSWIFFRFLCEKYIGSATRSVGQPRLLRS